MSQRGTDVEPTGVLTVLAVFVQRLVVKPSSNARLVVFKEPTPQAEKMLSIGPDDRLLKPQDKGGVFGIKRARAAIYTNPN
ncbi:hypothetical protein I6F15_27560 [Bradyrhizobium sp. BRP14]|nr:hypothetical protein [Bradyrhizobium sp. BRP14]